MTKESGKLFLKLRLQNFTNREIDNFKIQFNKNYFGLFVDPNSISFAAVPPGGISELKVFVDCNVNSDFTKLPSDRPPLICETALRCSLDEFYFNIPILFCVLFNQLNDHISEDSYLAYWKKITTTNDMCSTINNVFPSYKNSINLENKFRNYSIYLIHKKEKDNQSQLFFYAEITNSQLALICVYLNQTNEVNIVCKCESPFLINHIMSSVKYLLVNE